MVEEVEEEEARRRWTPSSSEGGHRRRRERRHEEGRASGSARASLSQDGSEARATLPLPLPPRTQLGWLEHLRLNLGGATPRHAKRTSCLFLLSSTPIQRDTPRRHACSRVQMSFAFLS